MICFYGLDEPQYISSPQPNCAIKSTVIFEFSCMKIFQYGGKMEMYGQAYTSEEAHEEAAYHALVLIEKNFLTKVVDYTGARKQSSMLMH